MDRKARTKTAKALSRYKNDNNLPFIQNAMSKTSTQFHPIIYKKRKYVLSADITKKYRLDSEKYKKSINLKKEKIFFLEKKCEILKDKNKFNDEIIKEILINNSSTYINNNQRKIIIKNSKENNQYIERVKDFKKNKPILENARNQYDSEMKENTRIKQEILDLNEDLKAYGNKLEQKKKEIITLKNKMKIVEKNKSQKKELLDKNEEENNKLNEKIVKYLKKQINSNKIELDNRNKSLQNNKQLIEELKKKYDDLEKKLKK